MNAQDLVLGLVGAGAMGEALIRGVLRDRLLDPRQVVAYDVRKERLQELSESLGIRPAASVMDVTTEANLVVLAVKPQHMGDVLTAVGPTLRPSQIVVSIAAGIAIGRIERVIAAKVPVVRVMPNTPALVGKGVCAISPGTHATDEHTQTVSAVLESVGTVIVVPEAQMDAVTGLSGSGPAYICLVVEALADGAVAEGLPRDVALRLAAETVAGAGQWIAQGLESGDHPAVLRERVTSPAGTTAAGLAALEVAATRAAFAQAVRAASARSKELGEA